MNTYVPKTIGEIVDRLGWMMFNSPRFEDDSGFFPERNIETTFSELKAALGTVRSKLGDERYLTLISMADRMRAHFESDPDDVSRGAIAGREIIRDMQDMLTGKKH